MTKIALVTVNKDKYSETFIHNQYHQLEIEKHFFYGAYLPPYYDNGKAFVNTNINSQFLLNFRFFRNKLINTIVSFCMQNEVKALLAHYGPAGVAISPVAQKLGIPLFVYFHGYDVYRKRELKKYLKHYPALFAQASALFAVSNDMISRLKAYGAPAHKIVYNPCGADMGIFEYNNAGANPPVFLAVGRLAPTKNPLATIAAFDIVQKKIPEARLRIAGEGELLSKALHTVKKLGLDEKVKFLGALSHIQIADEMKNVRAFVQHSVTTRDGDSEGAPVAIMEAGASGLPVVATRHAGIKDIITENATGFLVNENDVEGMAKHMIDVAQNPELATALGKNAHHRINQQFSLRKNIDILLQTINSKL